MSIDKSKLPPQLQTLLNSLESRGVHVEVLEANLGTTTGGQKTSEPSSTGSPEGYPPFNELLDKLAEVTAHSTVQIVRAEATALHGHLCPRIKTLEGDIKRQQEINETLFNKATQLYEQNGLQAQQIERLKGELLELGEIVRRQVGLLHKRVTKRKGEIKVVKAKAAATKGRVTKLAKTVAA